MKRYLRKLRNYNAIVSAKNQNVLSIQNIRSLTFWATTKINLLLLMKRKIISQMMFLSHRIFEKRREAKKKKICRYVSKLFLFLTKKSNVRAVDVNKSSVMKQKTGFTIKKKFTKSSSNA